MKFSIIIPAYNVADYLENCVESILKQTYDNYEVIIVNDGSTDETGKIADDLSLQFKQINVIHQSNGGASKARNTGMKEVVGDYILFLDGDDKSSAILPVSSVEPSFTIITS
ncbi:MAG: glycosyltransferase family 2 protein, partial [Streptococcus vestibularis]|nr:glycosyltransferase family 2 protein [Streptococcus vestibularis]